MCVDLGDILINNIISSTHTGYNVSEVIELNANLNDAGWKNHIKTELIINIIISVHFGNNVNESVIISVDMEALVIYNIDNI